MLLRVFFSKAHGVDRMIGDDEVEAISLSIFQVTGSLGQVGPSDYCSLNIHLIDCNGSVLLLKLVL